MPFLLFIPLRGWAIFLWLCLNFILGFGDVSATLPDTCNAGWRNPLPTGNSLHSVVYGGGQFVSVGAAGTLLTSFDGVSWASRISGVTNELSDITWSGNQFVAVGDNGTLLTSPDGIVWTIRPSGTTKNLEGVTWSGSQFVAVGDDGILLTSPDGANWIIRPSGTVKNLRGVTWSGHQFVAVTANGTILRSVNGLTWTNLQSSYWFNDVIWGDRQFVAITANGTILTSPDGEVWTPRFSGATNFLSGVIWSGTQFVVVGSDGTILTSPDGERWIQRFSGTTNALYGVTWSGNLFVAVGNYGTLLTSPDGEGWAPSSFGTTNTLYDVNWGGRQFVAVGSDGTLLTSTDGEMWTSRSSNTTNSLYGVTWGSGQFVVVGDGGALLTSSDGEKWTIRSSGTMNSLYGVIWSGSQFVAVGSDGTLLSSPDGMIWTPRSSGTKNDLYDVTWNGSLFVVVGKGSLTEGSYGPATLLTSPNGETWTLHSSIMSKVLRGVAWSGSQFVVVGGDGALLTSVDGMVWTPRSSGTTAYLEGVTWSGSQFLAVGWHGTRLNSPDGVSWTPLLGTKNTLYGATWNGSQFVVVGSGGTILTRQCVNSSLLAVIKNDASSVRSVIAVDKPQVTHPENKNDQSITFGTMPSMVVGGVGEVMATGGASGNPVSFASETTDVCLVNGGTVTGVAAGICTIVANQAGNANYNAAMQVTQRFAVHPLGLLHSNGLVVIPSGSGSGMVISYPEGIDCGLDCTEKYSADTRVTLTATPATDSFFVGWGGDCVGSGNVCTVTMTETKGVIANFNLAPYRLTVMKAGTGNGIVTSTAAGIYCGLDCTENYANPPAITLKAIPESGSIFGGWSGGLCVGTKNTCTLKVKASKTVVATFIALAPDFVVTEIKLRPRTPITNTRFAVRVTIKNAGTLIGKNVSLRVWSDQPLEQKCGTLNDATILDIGELAAGKRKSFNIHFNDGVSSKITGEMKTLRAFIDSECVVNEANENNNQFSKTYNVR